MSRPDLNIIVCVDARRCLRLHCHGRDSAGLLQALGQAVREHGLEDRVQVTPCQCIFGCTYGPRIDIARRWAGDKLLYGTAEGEVTISRRGRVRMSMIPAELSALALDNLPENYAPPATGENTSQGKGGSAYAAPDS